MSTTAVTSSGVNPAATGSAANTQTKSANAATDSTGLASENTFLQLLVAQLKNQDPQNPADGTQFVTQLAQFSGLEQQLGMKSDLDQILTTLKNPTAPAAASSTTPAAA